MTTNRRKNPKSKSKIKYPIILLGLMLFVVLLYFAIGLFKLNTMNKKLTLITYEETIGVAILIFDFDHGEVTKLVFPQNTEIELPDDLGLWKIKNIWKRGEDEGYRGGDYLKKTVLINFGYPINSWVDASFLKYIEKNNLFLAVFKPMYEEGIGLIEKIRIYILLSEVKKSGIGNIEPEDYGIIKAGKLGIIDGCIESITPPDKFYGFPAFVRCLKFR
jgi:hypothetical protein